MPHTLLEVIRETHNGKYVHRNFTQMREAYLHSSFRFEKSLIFQAKSKANASYNQYVLLFNVGKRHSYVGCHNRVAGCLLNSEYYVLEYIHYIPKALNISSDDANFSTLPA